MLFVIYSYIQTSQLDIAGIHKNVQCWIYQIFCSNVSRVAAISSKFAAIILSQVFVVTTQQLAIATTTNIIISSLISYSHLYFLHKAHMYIPSLSGLRIIVELIASQTVNIINLHPLVTIYVRSQLKQYLQPQLAGMQLVSYIVYCDHE